jgi:hypothetical protein
MSLEFYRVLHLVGIFALLLSLGGISLHTMNGGSRAFASRRWIAMAHGLALLVVLVAGFGMSAKMGLMASLPHWIYGKLVIWLILGGMPTLMYRKHNLAKILWLTTLVLAGIAAWLGIYQP